MNKKSRKTKGLSHRLIAWLLCCVCLIRAAPLSAVALEANAAAVEQTEAMEDDSAQGEILDTKGGSETFDVTVTAAETPASNIKRVEVYVCATDPETGAVYSQEMFDLLGISVLGYQQKWFTAGVFEIDLNKLSGNSTAYLQNADDWAIVKAALAQTFDSSCLSDSQAGNRNNNLPNYFNQIIEDLNKGSGSSCSALFSTTSQAADFTTTNDNYHLDIRFSCNRIIFKTGNNGIESGSAKDGTEIDDRVYITGSIIQPPRNGVTAPDGYLVVEGYYADADFTTPWNGIGTPLNEDQIVYVKFVRAVMNVIISKTVTGGMGDTNKAFGFTVTVKLGDVEQKFKVYDGDKTGSYEFTLSHGGSVTLTDVPIGSTVTVTEDDYGDGKGGYATSYTINNGAKERGNIATVTAVAEDSSIVFTNYKDASPDTGVLLDSLPYVLILVLVAVGAVLLIRRRRNRDDD